MFYVVIFILCAFGATKGQEISGCPLYGCTPGGTFSLDSVITSADVEVAWIAQLENSTTAANVLLGCVSNENNIVCPTSKGYVSLDPKTGKELWRKDILLKPSLPIMDVSGDIIGSDGRSLVMIDGDGTTQPIIKLDVPVDSIYSLNLLDIGAFLIVSKTGEVIAYLINGIPLASLTLTGEVDGDNGIFHPMAQPVISGNRAYILTKFKPKAQNVSKKFSTTGYYRMFAIGVVRRMTNIMFVAWEFTFSTALCQPDDHRVHSNEIRRNASLVVTGNNILVSLAADPSSFVTCSSRDQSDMFWSIKDNGNSSELMYSMPLLVSTLSVYVDNQPKNRHHYSVGPGLVWTSPFSEPGEIIGINLRNGTIVYKIPLSKYFGQNVSITTNIMVGQNTNGTILVFGVQNGTSARQNWVMGMQVTNGAVSTATLLWKLQVPVTGAAWGQVINFHVGPDDGGGVRLAVLSTDSNRPTLITIKSK